MNGPQVTFAIPAYRRPELLREALESIAGQGTDVDYEVVVADDGCLAESQRAAEQFPGGRCRYFANQPPLGAVGNWNRCIELARGTWITILHEDDALYPWYLSSVLPRLRDGLAAVCTQTVQGAVAPALRPPGSTPRVLSYPPPFFLKSSMTPFPGVLMRRETPCDWADSSNPGVRWPTMSSGTGSRAPGRSKSSAHAPHFIGWPPASGPTRLGPECYARPISFGFGLRANSSPKTPASDGGLRGFSRAAMRSPTNGASQNARQHLAAR